MAGRQQVLEPEDFQIGRALGGLAKTLEAAGKLEEALVPGVNYVGGWRQLRRRVTAPTPLPWQGGGLRCCRGRLACH